MPTRNRPLVLTGLSIVALTLCLSLSRFLLGADRPGGERPTIPAGASASRSLALEPTRSLVLDARPGDRVHEPAGGQGQAAQREPASTLSAAGEVRVTVAGRVVIRELDGTQNHAADGSFTLMFGDGQVELPMRMPVVQGCWSVELVARGAHYLVPGLHDDLIAMDPALTRLSAQDACFGEGLVKFSPEQAARAFSVEDISFHAFRAQGILLRVQDRESGAPLTQITLIKNNQWWSASSGYPGPGKQPLPGQSGLSSPVRFPIESSSRRFWVWSPGYAWNQILLDLSREGTRLIELQPGGTLEVQLSGAYHQGNLNLRLQRSGSANLEPKFEEPVAGQAGFLFKGLEPGVYRLTCELGAWHDKPVVLGATPVEIRADANVQALLEVALGEDPMLAPLAGSLELPGGWDASLLESVLLFDEALGEQESKRKTLSLQVKGERDAARRLHWDAGLVPVGACQATVEPMGHSTRIMLGPLGDTGVELMVPAPVEVTLMVRAAGSRSWVPT